jgi:hypothetical protein
MDKELVANPQHISSITLHVTSACAGCRSLYAYTDVTSALIIYKVQLQAWFKVKVARVV